MSVILKSFSSLYFATLLMLLGSGLLSTYLALRLAELDATLRASLHLGA